ncbi:MAG: hypothetical protein ACPL3C_08505 [Pyrobaculum sp.]
MRRAKVGYSELVIRDGGFSEASVLGDLILRGMRQHFSVSMAVGQDQVQSAIDIGGRISSVERLLPFEVVANAQVLAETPTTKLFEVGGDRRLLIFATPRVGVFAL